jgi:hypothetical protein
MAAWLATPWPGSVYIPSPEGIQKRMMTDKNLKINGLTSDFAIGEAMYPGIYTWIHHLFRLPDPRPRALREGLEILFGPRVALTISPIWHSLKMGSPSILVARSPKLHGRRPDVGFYPVELTIRCIA